MRAWCGHLIVVCLQSGTQSRPAAPAGGEAKKHERNKTSEWELMRAAQAGSSTIFQGSQDTCVPSYGSGGTTTVSPAHKQGYVRATQDREKGNDGDVAEVEEGRATNEQKGVQVNGQQDIAKVGREHIEAVSR